MRNVMVVAAVLAAMGMPLHAASPATPTTAASQPAKAAGIPLDRLEVLEMYSPGTIVQQGRDGRLWKCDGRKVKDEENAKRYAQKEWRYPLMDARAFEPANPKIHLGGPALIDGSGRRWFWNPDNSRELTIRWIEDGKLGQRVLSDRSSAMAVCPPVLSPADACGQSILEIPSDGLWVVALDKLWRYRRQKWESFDLPAPRAGDDARGFFESQNTPCHDNRLFRDGEVLWLVRSAYSNVAKPGSFLLRLAAGETGVVGTVSAQTRNEFIACVLRHGNQRLLFMEVKDPASGYRWATTPSRVLQGDANGEDWQPGALESYKAARLLAIDAQGRQFVQPYKDGQPAAKLLILDGKGAAVAVDLPSADLHLDLQAGDGWLYGGDRRGIIRMDTSGRTELLVPAGRFDPSSLRVLAVKDRSLCVRRILKTDSMETPLSFWVDPAAAAATPPLPGKAIADQLPDPLGADRSYPIVAANDTLYLASEVREKLPPGEPDDPQEGVATRLWSIRGDKLTPATDWVKWTSEKPTVWPLEGGAAIVVGAWNPRNDGGYFLYDGAEARRYDGLREMVKAEAPLLRKLMPDGVIFFANETYEEVLLGRIGDGFVMQDAYFGEFNNASGRGGGIVNCTGIYRNDAWEFVEQIGEQKTPFSPFDGLVGADVKTGRALAYADKGKKLQWIPVDSQSKPAETVLEMDKDFCWYWWDGLSAPRLTGAWILTEEAAKGFVKKKAELEAKGDDDLEGLDSADTPAFRRWSNGKWETLNRSFSGSWACQDNAGRTWLLRTDEIEVFCPDGTSQLIPTDKMVGGQLAVESDDAVWLATDQSLWRLALEKDAAGKAEWRFTHRFGLQSVAFDFAGPWIVGRDFYYASGGTLYYTTIDELIKTGAIKKQ